MTKPPSTTRREFIARSALGVIGGFAVESLIGCGSDSTALLTATTPATPSTSPVPDTGFVRIAANPSFVFAASLTNVAGAGTSSPIVNDYCLGKYLVTNADYKAFADATGRKVPQIWSNGTYPSGKGDHPVLYVSLADAQGYCAWRTSTTPGWTIRLPTEAEWENAAVGPSKFAYPWGNTSDVSYANGVLSTKMNFNAVCTAYYLSTAGSALAAYVNPASPLYGTSATISSIVQISATGAVTNWINEGTVTGFAYTDVFAAMLAAGGFTTAVGAYPAGASSYGCYDMAGNAWEWTSSLIVANNGAEQGTTVNAVRGGSWFAQVASCKATYRGEGRTGTGAFNNIGFRLAASPM